MRALPAACLLLAAGTPLAAAVAGAPEPGPTGVLPYLALTSSNDMLGSGVGNGDDYRTAGISGHVRLGRIVLAADAAMLTDRDAGTRSDEVVVTAGWEFGRIAPALGWHADASLGAGLQLDGDLHGQEVQNAVHRQIGAQQVDLADDQVRHEASAVGVASGAVGWLGPAGLGMTGWWGGQLVAAGRYVADGDSVAEAGPRLVLVGQEGAIWFGALYRVRDGRPPGPTAAATGRHEDGLWVDSGTFITPLRWGADQWGWQVRAAFNPESRAALGSLGLVVRPGVSAVAASFALEHDLAVYGGGGFGVQLRWYPYAYQDAHRQAIVLDYRFGTEPDGALHLGEGPSGLPVDAELRHDQWTLGWEEGYRTPQWYGMRFVPWAQAAAGVRQEGVMIAAGETRYPEGRATTGVLRGAAGVRLEWRDLLSVGASLDGWLPAWDERLEGAGESVLLNDPGWAYGLHLAAHIAW